MGLALEEMKDIMESDPEHLRRWVSGQASPDRSLYVTPAGEDDVPTTPDSVSGPARSQASTSTTQSARNVTSPDAHVRPSTSGTRTTSRRGARVQVNPGSDLDSEFDDLFDEPTFENAGLASCPNRDLPDDEELDVPEQILLGELQRTLDDEADGLGVSDSYEWSENFDLFSGVSETFSGPPPGPIKNYDTPYDAFTDIWSEDIINLIVIETNRYAEQTIDRMVEDGTMERHQESRLNRWKPTDANEIMVLFAVFMYMGIDMRSSQEEYWKADSVLEMPRFRSIMSYNRYVLLCKFLHFTDNQELCQDSLQYGEIRLSPKLMKIAPIIAHLDSKFPSLFNLPRAISIDESLTLFKGRLSWVQAIRTKAARFGIKSYELCDSASGYLWRFQIYTGKNSGNVGSSIVTPSDDLSGKSTLVVLELLKGLERRGHCVTMDNYYNCPALARYLKSKGFDCLGTLRVNRRNVPDELKARATKSMAKGEIIARHCGDLSVLAWKDSKVVTMISTYHDDATYVGTKAGRPLTKPVSIRDYNNTMGGVDLKDQKLSMYLVERKRGLKWYMKIFKRLLNISIHNAFILTKVSLQRRERVALTHRQFRYELAASLLSKHRPACVPRITVPVARETRLNRETVHAFTYLSGNKARKRCEICKLQRKTKLVHVRCDVCNVFLCEGLHWVQWHSLEELPVEERGRRRNRSD